MAVSKIAPKPSAALSGHGLKSAKRKLSKPVCRPRHSSEREIQMKAWQWVQKTHPELLIFHVPNGEHRDVRTAVKLKRMGLVPGVADFLCFTGTRQTAIEMKDDNGKQSDSQLKFEMRWRAAGGDYYVCDCLEDFQDLVDAIVMFG
jgi:hypothetical protein